MLPKGRDIVQQRNPFLLPSSTAMVTQHSNAAASDTSSNDNKPLTKNPASRKGKGTHGIRIVKALLQDKENWKSISCKDDYHFPGVFKQEQMQVVYYVPDCTKLDQCCNSNPHFLWHDIQLSKGKINRDYTFSLVLDPSQKPEDLVYRSAPCNGVKQCSASGCKFVTPVSHHRRCELHPNAPLLKSNEVNEICPVELAYVFPLKFESDHRRWVFGFVRQQKSVACNLHNHPIPGPSKMACMVKATIQQSACTNPQLKPSQIAQGKGVPFIPGVVDEASTHIGRISREVKKGRQQGTGGTSWEISRFESVADEIDSKDNVLASQSAAERAKIQKNCRPYLTSMGFESGIHFIHTMSPLMSRLLSKAEFAEADITFNETFEYKYLFHLAVFDDTTMEWAVVSRVRMDKEGTKAYALAFKKTFQKCEEDHPDFSPADSLLGVVTDWSDAEISGLGEAIGKEVTAKLL